jgi:hypothetical protein
MALPASGPISMSMIRTELQNGGKTTDLSLTFLGSMSGSGANRTSGYTPINQSSLTKPSSPLPASISEWYSYDHVTNKACGNPLNLTLGAFYTYVRYEVTGIVGSTSTTQMTMSTNPGNTIKCHIYTGSYPFTNLGTLTGTPVFNGTFTSAGSQFYSFNLASTSTILHVVAWDETVAVGNYLFAVNPSCGTTTTTTTQPPLTITNGAVTCVGNLGSFTSTFSGGSGTYHTAAIDNSQANVANLIGGGAGSGTGTRVILGSGATSYNWSGLANGTTWYTAVRDSAPTTAVQNTGVTINCTTTTTTTTSTTTTTTTVAGNLVTIYSAAGLTTGESYNLFYSQDNVNWTYVAGPLSSTTCAVRTTVNITSGTIYLKAQRQSDNAQVFVKGDNISTCPANGSPGGRVCTYSTAITGTEDVAITVWVDSVTGGFVNCSP